MGNLILTRSLLDIQFEIESNALFNSSQARNSEVPKSLLLAFLTGPLS